MVTRHAVIPSCVIVRHASKRLCAELLRELAIEDVADEGEHLAQRVVGSCLLFPTTVRVLFRSKAIVRLLGYAGATPR